MWKLSEKGQKFDCILKYTLSLTIADVPIDTFANEVIPWAETVDATVNPSVASKCEYYHEMVVEASMHRA